MKIKNGLNLDDAAYYIADSAIYSEKNIQQLGADMLWITRIPATITESESLLDRDIELVECLDLSEDFEQLIYRNLYIL
jgi:transposase